MEMLKESDLLEKSADEIRMDKQAWLDLKARNRAKSDEASYQYRQAQAKALQPITDTLKNMLSKYDMLTFDIRPDFYDWYGKNTVEVRIQCDENSRSEHSSLRWDMEFKLDEEGNVERKSGSWSGLEACTPENIAHLKQCVAAIEELSNVDWKTLLAVSAPNFNDFYNFEKEDETKPYDFDAELKIQQLREILNQNKAVKFYHPKLDSMFWAGRRGDYWLQVTKITPKGVRGRVWVEDKNNGGYRNTSYADGENFTLDKLSIEDDIIDV